MNRIELLVAACAAANRGYDTPARLAAYLERLIVRNEHYLERRARRGQGTAFDAQVEEDNLVLAALVVLLKQDGEDIA
jgi:hypothetical protein